MIDLANDYAARAATAEARAVDDWLRSYGFTEDNIAESGVTLQRATHTDDDGNIVNTYRLVRTIGEKVFVHRLDATD